MPSLELPVPILVGFHGQCRARLRMTTLYAVAAERRALVAGTGNKVEDFGVGFYTKYGDGGVDLSPIADLLKNEVYALGRALGVGEAILNAAPTDGLWGEDRTDEDQLGATYDELEWAMEQVAAGRTADTFDSGSREAAVLEIYLRHHRANRHKMDPIPVCESRLRCSAEPHSSSRMAQSWRAVVPSASLSTTV